MAAFITAMTVLPNPTARRARPDRRTPEWIAVGAAGAVVVASLVLAGWVLHRGGSAPVAETVATTPLPRLTAAQAAAPSVLSRRFRGLPLAGHDRDVLVGVGAQRGGPLDVVVIPSDESAVSPGQVTIVSGAMRATGEDASSCGSRCFRFPLRVLGGSPTRVSVTLERPGKPEARVALAIPARLPPTADRLYRTVHRNMHALRSLGMSETLGAGLGAPVVSRWTLQAPDRLRYEIAGGSKAVVIGRSRWDESGGRWTRTSTVPLTLPAYAWDGARGARLLGRGRVLGKRVRILAAMQPGAEFPAWFRLYVTGDGRVVRMQMLTTGHFMVDTYSSFDSAPAIRPPG